MDKLSFFIFLTFLRSLVTVNFLVKTVTEQEDLLRESPFLHLLEVMVPHPWDPPSLLDQPVTLNRAHHFILNIKLLKVLLHLLLLHGMTKYDFNDLNA